MYMCTYFNGAKSITDNNHRELLLTHNVSHISKAQKMEIWSNHASPKSFSISAGARDIPYALPSFGLDVRWAAAVAHKSNPFLTVALE